MPYDLSSFDTIPQAFLTLARRSPKAIVYGQAIVEENDLASNTPRKRFFASYQDVQRNIKKIALYLRSLGLEKGTKVAILSGTRAEWMEADIAILMLGGISVSVYQSLPTENIGYILFDSESEVVFAENQQQVDKLLELTKTPFPMPGHEDREATLSQITLKKIIAFETVKSHPLVEQYGNILQQAARKEELEMPSISSSDLAALVYTSGTTGPPKGVMQTHGNHLANVRQGIESGIINDSSIICLFLPLAHSFAKLMGYIGFLTPVELRFPAVWDRQTSAFNAESTSKDVRESGATIFPVVPRILEKMLERVLSASRERSLKGGLLSLTVKNAEAFSSNSSSGLFERCAHCATKRIRDKLKNQLFGHSFEFCISGGAKLPTDVALFFNNLDIEILEGYGLTETCVATNVCRPGKNKVGTVGPVMGNDIEMVIAEDGEILFRGPNVSLGYYHRKTATRESWDSDGWFHTGDLGHIDSSGNLSVSGRKKEIIITSGGKNIAPHDIEEKIKSSILVSQTVLIGDGRKFCVALLSLNLEAAKHWAEENNLNDVEDLHTNEKIRSEILSHLDEINKQLPSHETIKAFHIVPEDFSIENGLMTPTYKIKRNAVVEAYKEDIDKLYEKSSLAHNSKAGPRSS